MLNRDRVLAAFRQALEEMKEEEPGRVRPRTVAVRAHRIYCSLMEEGAKSPALVTFRKFVSGRSALPEILDLLNQARIQRAPRVRLDRSNLHQAFRQAVAALEGRILMGRVRPLDVARKAYDIYLRSLSDIDPRPSKLTFHSLVYDRDSDEEIRSLLSGLRARKEVQ